VFDEALGLLDAATKMGDDALFAKWLAIADELTEGDGWRLALLGDELRNRGSAADRTRMLAYYDAAIAKGNRTAVQRVLSVVGDDKSQSYDPLRAAELYATLVTTGRPDEWVSALAKLNKEDDAIRTIAFASVHPVDIYRKAALANDPIGMREYGLLLRDAAESAETLQQSGEWLARAAQAGDGRAMVEYAEMLAYGIGGKQSPDEALVWLKRAADLGFEDADRLVRSLRLAKTETQ
jgi:TPR repeat protein